MGLSERISSERNRGIGDFIGGLFGRRNARPPRTSDRTRDARSVAGEVQGWPQGVQSSAPQELINDAATYGVSVSPATAAPGEWYWQVIRIHHLTPEENAGNHHIYLDMSDPDLVSMTNLAGRAYGASAKISWPGGEERITIQKPLGEPGANFAVWKWQVCTVQALGFPRQELPSDSVAGIHTGHPDETAGNTLFHHSFHITFSRVRASDVAYQDSILYGVIRNASGRTALLIRDDQTVASQVIGTDSAFCFTDLGAGEYLVAVEGSTLRSELKRLNGRDQAQLAMVLPLEGKPLAHYVLFGPAERPATRANWLLAQDFLLAFGPSFGFSPDEAKGAVLVTILADEVGVSAQVEASLAASGATVQRISGTVTQIAEALASRIAKGQETA